MPRFKKVAIIGVGLLGGSLGLAIKSRSLARRVTGHFRNPGKIAPAVARGAIDEGTCDLKEAVRGADLIILATPVQDILDKLKQLRSIAASDAVVCDIGSTKTMIDRAAAILWPARKKRGLTRPIPTSS
jgi:prephenate dehydrogenase